MISVIILHHDKAEYALACLQSLLCSTARPLEVINIANGSRDAAPAAIAWKAVEKYSIHENDWRALLTQ